MSEVVSMMKEKSELILGILSSKNNLIPQMDWERAGGASMQITVLQFRFFLCFISACLAGYGLKLIRSPTARHIYAIVTGLALVYYPFGSGVLQAVYPSVLTYLVMVIFPSNCGSLAWLINFPYLIWLHVMNASGTSWSAGMLDFTGADMTLVLKLISLAVNYQNSFVKDKERLSQFQKEHVVYRVPSLLEYLSFIFCLGNLLGGPYLEFSTYKEFMELKGVWDPKKKPPPSAFLRGLGLMFLAVCFMAAHVVSEAMYGCNPYVLINTAEWYPSLPLMMKWLAISVSGFCFQFRFYFAWLMSEASLTFAGLNFIAWDEKGKDQWGRVHNADVAGMWLAESGRTIAATWNVQTGVFLRHYVYERLVSHNKKPGFVQLLITQLVCAVWHGLYPGYLLYFLSTVFYLHSSTIVFKLERAYLPQSLTASIPYRAFKVLYTQLTVSYLCTTFIALDFPKCIAVWSSPKYIPWYPILALLIIQWVVPLKSGAPKSAGGKPATLKKDE